MCVLPCKHTKRDRIYKESLDFVARKTQAMKVTEYDGRSRLLTFPLAAAAVAKMAS